MKRLAEFLRSVIPADPTQLIFLDGVVCLFIAPRLRWWALGLDVASKRVTDSIAQQAQILGVFFLMSVSFAGVVGYSFVSGRVAVPFAES